jgi:hypothetical protein
MCIAFVELFRRTPRESKVATCVRKAAGLEPALRKLRSAARCGSIANRIFNRCRRFRRPVLAGLLRSRPGAATGGKTGDAAQRAARFLIAYPVEVFEQKADPTTDEGRALHSRDGHAQLLVGAQQR